MFGLRRLIDAVRALARWLAAALRGRADRDTDRPAPAPAPPAEPSPLPPAEESPLPPAEEPPLPPAEEPPPTPPAPPPGPPRPPAPRKPPPAPPMPPPAPPEPPIVPPPAPPEPPIVAPPEVPAPPPPAPSRYLSVTAPEQAPVGCHLAVLVQVVLDRPDGAATRLEALDVPESGASLTIIVSAPGLTPDGDTQQELRVPGTGDSAPIWFGFRAGRAGTHTVRVLAFRGGTFLGEVCAQISVRGDVPVREGAPLVADLAGLPAEPGAATLVISRTDEGHYSFHLTGDGPDQVGERSERLAADPSRAVGALVAELCRMAAGDARYRDPAEAARHLQNLGIGLWTDAVPEAIRRQFWDQAPRIRTLTIDTDTDVPWELLYPADGSNDNGFLVSQFPVVRRVRGQGPARRLALRDAAYVVPPGSPGNALDEVRLVRSRIGSRVADRGTVQQLDELQAFLDQPPCLLHFSCHNDFSDETGSVIRLVGGPLQPADLNRAVARRSLHEVGPLIFLNACRTAGEIPGLTRTSGWASQFMAAGAGAFLGSLWAVRSSAAQEFADAFYESFVTRRLPLGEATLQARRRTVSPDGDPTWLAYTMYGDPSATLVD